jgi:hypothetical protein
MGFRKLGPNWAEHTDGFSVRVRSRFVVEYEENGHLSRLELDPGPPHDGIYPESLTCWEEPHSKERLSPRKKLEIVQRVIDALDFTVPGYLWLTPGQRKSLDRLREEAAQEA